jgi:hypothetical protein
MCYVENQIGKDIGSFRPFQSLKKCISLKGTKFQKRKISILKKKKALQE